MSNRETANLIHNNFYLLICELPYKIIKYNLILETQKKNYEESSNFTIFKMMNLTHKFINFIVAQNKVSSLI